MRMIPAWAIPPKHDNALAVTENGWEDAITGEVLVSVKNLPNMLLELKRQVDEFYQLSEKINMLNDETETEEVITDVNQLFKEEEAEAEEVNEISDNDTDEEITDVNQLFEEAEPEPAEPKPATQQKARRGRKPKVA